MSLRQLPCSILSQESHSTTRVLSIPLPNDPEEDSRQRARRQTLIISGFWLPNSPKSLVWTLTQEHWTAFPSLNCSIPTVNCCLTNGVLPPSFLPDSPMSMLSFHDQCHSFSRLKRIFLGQFYISLWELSSHNACLVSGLGTRNPLYCRLNFTVMFLVLLPIQGLQQNPQSL